MCFGLDYPHTSHNCWKNWEKERAVFEYWSHAASYLPMRDFRYTLPMKSEILAKDRFWFEKDQKVMQHVLDRISTEGPLMSKDFEKPEDFKVTQMWDAAPTKRALQNLFMEGRVMVKARQGFQKVYDLAERVLPNGTDTTPPSREDYIRYLMLRDIRAHGIISSREMGYLLKGCQKEIREQARILAEQKEIISCAVRGLSEEYFTTNESLELLSSRFSQQVKILSPFDNLLINRARTEELFGFEYTLECYVPAPKRVFGYFGLPILYKNNLVGQIDAKANRESQQLEVRNMQLHLKAITDDFTEAWKKELSQFMAFQGVSSVALKAGRSDLGKEVIAMLCSLE